jgi:diguanylate cyclase (GGDEF)-like protein
MNLLSFFKNATIVKPTIDKYKPLYIKIVVLNIILVSSAILFFSFGLFYIFVQSSYKIGIFELIATVFIIYALYRVRYKDNIKLTAVIVITAVFSVLLALVIFKKAEHLTIIWTIFVPLSTIFVYGTKQGLRMTVGFYAVVFTLAYYGIGVWQEGYWNHLDLIRYVVASTLLTIVIFVLENALEEAHEAIEERTKKEKAYIKQLTQYSITDPLTKLYNRRYLDEAFHKNFQVAQKSNSLFVFTILDLDFFKNYNDTHGHKEGDEVLIKVSNILNKNMQRDSDQAFRVGGEEFVCLMMAREEANVFAFIEKIRKDIEDTKLITASFGVCIIDSFELESLDEMYKIADKFLYEAKEKGRNQVLGGLTKLTQSIESIS